MAPTVYDVTTWPGATVSPYNDIGLVINQIIADIKSQQTTQTTRPGAVIYIPPGHYTLQTTANIDIGFLTIKGSGHGFMSEAIRDDVNHSAWVETLPGSSHVQIANNNQVGFLVNRATDPGANGRLNSIIFQDFCIDGVSSSKPYLPGNGKTGIKVQYDTDAIRVEGMGFVYLANALVVRNADAFNVTNNFIGECGNSIQMTDSSIVGKITNNYLISAWAGSSIFIENNENCVVSGNSLLWGARIQMKNVHRAVITGNKFVSNFSGIIVHETPCHEQLISSNHFRRIFGDGGPARNDDLYGMVHINGNDNSVTSNTFSFDVPAANIVPSGATPTVVLVKGGARNFLATNKLVSNVAVRHVLDSSTTATKVLWSGKSSQVQDLSGGNMSLVPTP
jgi:inulin fructotransferase (DFA-I-forming)